MASSGHVNYLSRRRIIDNVEMCKSGGTPNVPGEEKSTVPSQTDDAQRILSQPGKAKARKKRRKKPHGRSVIQVVVLGAIGVGGIAVIIGLRNVAEIFGVNWIGD